SARRCTHSKNAFACGRTSRTVSNDHHPKEHPVAKSPPRKASPTATEAAETKLRLHAEQLFADELSALKEADDKQRPPNWAMSPWAVKTYLLGGKLKSGVEITPKYIGNERLIEIAVATLATDRALLLYGVPGTAKSWVSEHLSAAI